MANSINPELVRAVVLEVVESHFSVKFDAIHAEMRQLKAKLDEKVAKLEAKLEEKALVPLEIDAEAALKAELEELKKQAKPYFNQGLAIAVGFGQQALQDAKSMLPQAEGCDDGDLAKASRRLVEAQDILGGVDSGGWVPNKKLTARAYDYVREARQLVHRAQPMSEGPVKAAALIVREVVALQCCAAAASGSSESFMAQCVEAYGRTNLDNELKSQMHLSRSSIMRYGVNRKLFDESVPFGQSMTMTEEQRSKIFSAYCAASASSGRISGWSRSPSQSRAKSRGSRSPRPSQSRKSRSDLFKNLGEPMFIMVPL